MNKFSILIQIIKKYKVYIICAILIFLSLVSVIIQNIDRKSVIKINGNEIKSKDGKIAVYLSGEVKNTGVYYLDLDSRLDKLLDIAGGVTEKADISKLNLAQKLLDGDKIVVSAKVDITQNTEGSKGESEIYKTSTDCIDINNANKEELMTLSGIGESIAKKIIEYRKDNNFQKVEDIKNVSGIGDAKFNTIKDNICVE
jgi:competence protein ComEA